MRPDQALFVALAIYALVRFVFLRTSRELFRKGSLHKQAEKAPSIAALEKLQEIALTAALVFAAFWLFVLVVDAQGGSSAGVISASLHRLDSLLSVTRGVTRLFSGILFIFAFAVFAYLWYRAMKRQVMQNLAESISGQVEGLKNQQEWAKLEPTAEMREVLRRIQTAYLKYETLGHSASDEAERRRLAELIEQWKEHYISLDVERRIQLSWEEDYSGHGRLRRMLLSRGVFSRGRGIGKVLSRATTALLFACLVGFQSDRLAQAMDKKIVELRDLQVNMTVAAAERDLKQARTTEARPSQPTAEQQKALNHLARSFSNSFARAWNLERAKTSPEARAERVRWVVEKRTAGHAANQPDADRFYAEATSSGWKTEARASMHDYERTAADPYFRSPLQNQFVHDAAAEGLHNEPRVAEFAARAAKEDPYDSAVLFTSVEDFEAEEAIGGLIDGISDNFLTSDLAKVVFKGASKYAKEHGTRTYKAARAKFFSTFLQTGDLRQADAAVRATTADLLPADLRAEMRRMFVAPEEVVEQLQRSPAAAAREQEDFREAEELLKETPKERVVGEETALANLLSGYEAEFPRTGTLEFARDRVLKSWGVSDTNALAERTARATNFERLQTYSRVGGILFGRVPPQSSALSLTGLRWSKEPGGYTLAVSGGGGAVTMGPFPAYLVSQALRYASDGRATVLTMMNASGIGRKQVIMHPAFRDTPLGCRLMAADEWVFDYTDAPSERNTSQVRRLINQAGMAVELYKDAIRFLNKTGTGRLRAELTEELRSEAQAGVTLLQSSGLKLDAHLLGAIAECVKPGVASWQACVITQAEGGTWKGSLPKDPPNTQFVSQMSEAPYALATVSALAPPDEGDPMWPLNLTVQLTVDDKERWEFPGFAAYGPQTVVDGLARDHKLAQWNEVRSLCALQRLFRAAFAGKLGPDFPVERLVRLADETSGGGRESCRTPNWLAERGGDQIPVLGEFRAELDRYMRDASSLQAAPPGRRRFPREYDQLWRDATPGTPASGFDEIRSAPQRIQTCKDALLQGVSAETLKRSCVWSGTFENTRASCAAERDSKGFAFDSSANCRLWWVSYLGILTSQRYELRDALKARTAPAKASELDCARMEPPVSAAAIGSLVRYRAAK